jgi:hypothetical protein
MNFDGGFVCLILAVVGNYPPPCAGRISLILRGMGRSDLERLSREELIELDTSNYRDDVGLWEGSAEC